MSAPASPPRKPTAHNSPTPIRLGDLKELAQKRVETEGIKNLSVLVRSAVRLYLTGASQGELRQLERLIEELIGFRRDFSRVGGNLNQLTHFFNRSGELRESELRQMHMRLQAEFKTIIALLREIESELRPFKQR